MEFKRCVRCGGFFVTEGDVCGVCMPKDRLDMYKFNDYTQNTQDMSADSISVNTGISLKNVNRYLNKNV